MPTLAGKVKRPEVRISAVVTRVNGDVLDMGQIAGKGQTKEDRAKGRAARKILNAVEKKRLKEARHGS